MSTTERSPAALAFHPTQQETHETQEAELIRAPIRLSRSLVVRRITLA